MNKAARRLSLSRTISARDFLALGFGTIIGVGWVIVLGEWLSLAGPMGAILAFLAGGLAMMLVAFCYAELSTSLPVAGGEMAYAYEIFGLKLAFATAWVLALVFIAFTAFEAVAFGWLISTLIPSIDGPVLYVSRGEPVRLGSLALGLAMMAVITYFNYRGAAAAVRLQKLFIYAFAGICLIFVGAGIVGGNTANMQPLFHHDRGGSVLFGVLAIFVTTPLWYAGFNVIPQAMEERAAGTSLKSVGRVIVLSIGLAAAFYSLVILSAAMATPWRQLLALELPAAGAFEAVLGRWLGNLVILAAVLGVLTTWNAVFIAATRLLFALGRARIILPAFGKLQPVFRSPANAVLFVGAIGTLGALLGRAAILPIVNVGAVCFAFAYLVSCIAVIRFRHQKPEYERPYRVPGGAFTAGMAAVVTLLMLFMALYQPFASAGGQVPLEWIILVSWLALGSVLWVGARKLRARINEDDRRELIFGALRQGDPMPVSGPGVPEGRT